jgi:uncharacterized protein YbjT (DUF2867 family)
MTADARIATVFGATGFVGRALVAALARAGWRVKAAARRPQAAYDLMPLGTPGQIAAVPFAAGDAPSIAHAVEGAYAVFNAVGILAERRRGDFVRLHADLPAAIGRAARLAGVRRVVHLSALGIESAPSRYAESKLWGDAALRAAFAGAAVLRPSVLFGPGDGFFCRFARLSRVLPALPLIGGGRTRFQPVYVGDVAAAALAAVAHPGQDFALGGPEVITFREALETVARLTGRRRALVPVPWWLATAQGAVLQYLPGPLLTADQVAQLRADSVVPPGAPGLEALGVRPTALEAVLPRVLGPHAQESF